MHKPRVTMNCHNAKVPRKMLCSRRSPDRYGRSLTFIIQPLGCVYYPVAALSFHPSRLPVGFTLGLADARAFFDLTRIHRMTR
jgi:hypothetical protein